MGQRDLIIVGAGQAGLATAFAAREMGLDAVMLEATPQPAGSWPAYYDSLRLFSQARYSSLPGRTFPGDSERYPTRDEVIEYLIEYAGWLQPDVRLGQRVRSVELREGEGLAVETSTGVVLRAPRVIVATGGFGAPYRPPLQGLDEFPGMVLHSRDYRSPESFGGQRVVVVGGGNSAVQIAAELAESARVTLATRSPLRWLPQRLFGRDGLWWLTRSGLDSAPIGRWLHRRTMPVLDDGRYRRAVAAGRPDRRPMFQALAGDEVVWSDGEREVVHAIILATGYRADVPFLAGTGALSPAGEPLQRDGVSTTVPGVGYVGLEFQRTFASATIRGVGRDAEHALRRLRPASEPAPADRRAATTADDPSHPRSPLAHRGDGAPRPDRGGSLYSAPSTSSATASAERTAPST